MNNAVEKVKQYFSSNFGKLAGLIIGLSFIITLILSVLYKNRIDVSLVKAIISAVITAVILFLLGVVLKKYLGDVIDESVSASSSSNLDIDYGAIDDNTMEGYEHPKETILSNDTSSNTQNNSSSSVVPNLDKSQKTDYSSSGDDIGSIVFGSSNSASANTAPSSCSSSSSMFPDKKVKDSDIIKEVHEDPEKVAKAVRTMIAKDEKENK